MGLSKVEIRPRRSMWFFALLSIFMVVASYLFVILLAAACVYLPYLILSNMETPDFRIILLLLFGVVIAATMLWSLLPRRDKFEAPGLLLDPASQPRLFAELENIAASLNEPMPREVYLIGDVNAFVADRGGFLGIGSRRVMGLGLPLMSILTVSQFRAVLAHEFAHYYGGDTSLGPWVYKTQKAMVRIFENVGSVGELARIAILGAMYLVVATLMKWYFILFLRAMNFASRKREFRADELACLVAGREPLVEGLRAIHGAALAWPTYWNTEIAPVVSDGALPGVGQGFARFVAVPRIDEQIRKEVDREIKEAKTNPYDSHPPLRDRIAAAANLEGGAVQNDARLASSLLDHLDKTELRFLETVNTDIKPDSVQCISWDDLATRVTIPGWRKFTGDYSSALQGVTAESLPAQIPNLLKVGNMMRDPKGLLLGPDQRARRAAHFFAIALALALLDRGWTLDVAPGIFELHGPAGEPNLFPILDQLMAGKLSPQDWSAQCHKLGIADVPLSPASTQQLELLPSETYQSSS